MLGDIVYITKEENRWIMIKYGEKTKTVLTGENEKNSYTKKREKRY